MHPHQASPPTRTDEAHRYPLEFFAARIVLFLGQVVDHNKLKDRSCSQLV